MKIFKTLLCVCLLLSAASGEFVFGTILEDMAVFISYQTLFLFNFHLETSNF